MNWPATIAGFAISHHARLPSTQDVARGLAKAGARAAAVVADEQTSGHGRQGRGWVSPPGNLYMSIVTPARLPATLLPAGSLVAAVALCRAVERGGHGQASLSVKWPNDVLIDGRKVAGLLLEVVDDAIVIGCGVNIAATPPDLPTAATLAGVGLDAPPPVVLERFLSEWTAAMDALAAGDRTSWREAWLARAAGLHRPIRVKLADRVIEGVHRGIDEVGALRVETAGATELVLAGDVELVRLGETL